MGIFQIVFLAINLAVPYWLWFRTTPDKAKTVDWTVLEKNLARLIESDEGFPDCSTLQVVEVFHDQGNIRVGWRLEENPESELVCREPGGDIVPHAPEFNFNISGRMRSIADSSDRILCLRT